MSEMQLFEHPEFGRVPCYMIDGAPWFVGRDVALVLGYTNTRKALRDHVPAGQRKGNDSFPLSDLGLHPQTVLISEAGLYWLIIRSNMPKAEEFTSWVTEELLPTVRKAQAVGIDVVKELTERTEELRGELDMEKAMNQVMHMEVFNTDVRIQEQLAQAWDEGMTQGRYSSRDDRQLYNPYRQRMVTVGAKYTAPAKHWTKLQERRMLRQFP